MLNLRQVEKEFLASHVGAGDTVVDFTMGNGNDTLWLSGAVGPTGKVYAFDIQPEALYHTRKRLDDAGAARNFSLILASHHKAKEYLPSSIRAGIFNLGFLPGGDRSVTTLCATTLPAIADACDLLAPGGALLVAVYPGHAEGRREGEALEAFFASPDPKICSVSCLRIVNSPDCPFFYLYEKNL